MSVRSKALGYLRGQNVRVLTAKTPGGTIQPAEVEAIVRGHRGDYLITLDGHLRAWSCTCPQLGCAHIAAVQMVTGHRTAAAKAST